LIGRFDREAQETRLIFETPRRRGASLFDWGHILIEFRGESLNPWVKGEVKGEGFQRLPDDDFLLRTQARNLPDHHSKPMHSVPFVSNSCPMDGANGSSGL
jgi:hypothetical protein